MNTRACGLIRQMVLSVVVCAFLGGVRTAWGTPDPPPCTEYGPHVRPQLCMPGGMLLSPGVLSQTNLNVLVGQHIYPPVFVIPPVYSEGMVSNNWDYDCNDLTGSYGGLIDFQVQLFFSPVIPASINAPGVSTYTARIVGYPVLVDGVGTLPPTSTEPFAPYDLTCSHIVTNTVATVTVTVWAPGDSDYDGICDMGEAEDGTNPNNPSSVLPVLLGYWRFENTNTWAGEEGQLPIAFTNLIGTPSFSGAAVVVDNANGAVLQYRDVETNVCAANINLRSGTVEFWFKADWNSASTNSGTGPQGDGRMIEVGARGGSGGWWSLGVGAAGTNLYFCTQTNSTSTLTTNLSATINWVSNQWHQVVLTYSTNNSSLYLDGFPVLTNGMGVAVYPGSAVRAQGFTVGGSASGASQARGAFDELQTYNYALYADTIFGQYQSIIGSPGYDQDGDGVPNGNDADPMDPGVGALPFAIRISQPANGSVMY